MALMQGSFVCLVVLYPEAFGIYGATEENLEDFCYVWKGIGYLLGIDDEFSFCRGSLEDIKKRSEDYLNEWIKPNFRNITPEWEHMMRCLSRGIQYYLPIMSYELNLLYTMELMNIDMARLWLTRSYKDWMRYYTWKLTLNYGCRFPFIRQYLNKFFNDSVNGALAFTEEQLYKLRIRSTRTLRSSCKNNC